jgi:hypothetical protein
MQQIHPAQRFQSSLELSPEWNSEWFRGKPSLPPVSILTRAFARVERASPQVDTSRAVEFQSSLELSPEWNNPRPGLSEADLVSILTRAFARVEQGEWSTGKAE